ncbi:MAG: hypothetical protein E4G74_02150 [Erysipelotrichales bacterium]|nr:MAG: hypothetical protein E4G74_02150 [Erysipelotrichales bacterium]
MKKFRTRTDIERHHAVDQMFRDSDGWWVWLKAGYWSTNMECGTIHEMTIGECCEQMQYVERAPLEIMQRGGWDLAECITNWEGETK